ncbi:hypothetical protein Nepgr_021773 [Nepenthes gracilis]|uniref:Chromatin modification-related protein MEAF6 n=1 Tax=Nepenthes gracilis TaxID=150966 RepID=A0AAD3XW75_NEPGR|nr:hypothetical protein Nepgr_021773 [Nepenthes gracilis]
MESNVLGQKTSNPAAKLTSLRNKREKLQHELRNIEKQVYELETTYLQETNHFADILKGYDGFLSSSKSTTSLKRSRKLQPEDRLFSLSSVTSPAVEEHGRDFQITVLVDLRVMVCLQMDRENQRREDWPQEMEKELGCQVKQVLKMKMTLRPEVDA